MANNRNKTKKKVQIKEYKKGKRRTKKRREREKEREKKHLWWIFVWNFRAQMAFSLDWSSGVNKQMTDDDVGAPVITSEALRNTSLFSKV